MLVNVYFARVMCDVDVARVKRAPDDFDSDVSTFYLLVLQILVRFQNVTNKIKQFSRLKTQS